MRCRLANALRMAATTLYRSHSALGDYFRRLRARLGSPAAITPPLTNLLASSLPCFVIVALSILNSWGTSTKNIFAALKTPCPNTPLLSALILFLSRILPIQFLRSDIQGLSADLLEAARRRNLSDNSLGSLSVPGRGEEGFFAYPRRKVQFGITPLKRPQFRSDLSQFPNDFVQIDRLCGLRNS